MLNPDEHKAMQVFAWRLRAVRRAFGGSQGNPHLSSAKFAGHLGIEPNRYRRYERGEIEPPLLVLTALRRVTGVSLDLLICGETSGNDNMISSMGMRSDDEVILADRLRGVRELAGLDPKEVAKVLNVREIQWTLWESGRTRPDPSGPAPRA